MGDVCLDAFHPQPPSYTHRGNGKIARLPKSVRDQINNWILDGVPYPEIIQRLGDQGKELNPRHFSEFRKRGHQDWLRQREWFEHVTAKSEFSKYLLAAPDSTTLHEAGLRMVAAQMIDQLMRFIAVGNPEKSQPDPEQFARLIPPFFALVPPPAHGHGIRLPRPLRSVNNPEQEA